MWFSVAATLAVAAVLAALLYFIFWGISLESLGNKIAFLIVTLLAIPSCGLCVWSTLIVTALMVKIEDGFLKLRFGAGAWRKEFALRDIESYRCIRTDFWRGWGIRLYRNGWLYNVAGYDAVEIKMKNGKINCIGTDQPQKLTEAISNALGGIS